MRRLILRSFQSPGDILMMTAAVRDLHTAHPQQFQTDIRTSADALWAHNPHITKLQEGEPGVEVLEMHYPLIHQSNDRPFHFIHGYPQFLESVLGLKIPVTRFRGDIHLSEEERNTPPAVLPRQMSERNYWIMMAGGKYDFTAKWWNPASYQAVVDHFQGDLQFVQCGEAGHWHPRLRGVVDLVGKTSTRDFVHLMHHAQGVVCPVTFAMHLAAAVPARPGTPSRGCVVIAGGREPPQWEAYPQHQFLSTVGAMTCCATGGCWKSRCQKVGDGDSKDRYELCEQPVKVAKNLHIPRCMEIISPADVIRRIELYYQGGSLKSDKLTEATSRIWISSGQGAPREGDMVRTSVEKPAIRNNAKTERTRVLIKFTHGLGDAVQLTSLLRHLAKYRPEWAVDVASLTGKHSAFHGLCERSLILGKDSVRESDYLEVWEPQWLENHAPCTESPSTKLCKCLKEVFGITPDPELLSYQINCSDKSLQKTRTYLQKICGDREPDEAGRFPVVAIHYEGNTSCEWKNLPHHVAKAISEKVLSAGMIPLILDWDHRSPLPDQQRIFCPDVNDHDLWNQTGTGDAESLAALISQCKVMIGIDSGPLHVAGATTTPTLGVWTKHFPTRFVDLCPNILHLVPQNWREMVPDRDADTKYFERNYRFETYQDLEISVCTALEALLKQVPPAPKLIRRNGLWVRSDNVKQDLVVYRDIIEQDAYQTRTLPNHSDPEVVFDIGAHIGCFARLWHTKHPQARIVCVEACPENLEALRANVGEFAEIVHAACTYEQRPIGLLNAVRPDCESTGGSVVVPSTEMEESDLRQPGYNYWHDHRELPKITLEELMSRMGCDRVDVLKLDCEGSEYSILEGTSSLEKIEFILGEYHFTQRWESFRQKKFDSQWRYHRILDGGENGGLFHLQRRPQPRVINEPGSEVPGTREDSVVEKLLEKRPLVHPPYLTIAVPAGIGDAVWTLTKMPHMLRDYGVEKVRIALCGGPPHRSKPFVERFDFVESVEYSRWECVEADRYTPEGVYNWSPSGIGWHDEFDWMMQANRHLEQGKRLETWLPQFETEFSIADHFQFTGRETRLARDLESRLGKFCVFYLGPEAGNTTMGHNRGPLWTPEEWGQLATYCRWLGLAIVVVGAEYDRSYFEKYVRPHLGQCEDAIGRWEIAQTFAVVQRAKFVVSYQSGVGIFAAYMGVPSTVFWRPHGNSIEAGTYLTFSEQMASAWVPPSMLESGRYLPSIYTHCSPESIVDHAVQHGWT